MKLTVAVSPPMRALTHTGYVVKNPASYRDETDDLQWQADQ